MVSAVVFFVGSTDPSDDVVFFGILPTFSSAFGWIFAKVSLSFSACVLDDSDFLSFELLELEELEDFDDDDLCLLLSRLLLDDDELLL